MSNTVYTGTPEQAIEVTRRASQYAKSLQLPDGTVINDISSISSIELLKQIEKFLLETKEEGFSMAHDNPPTAILLEQVLERIDQLKGKK